MASLRNISERIVRGVRCHQAALGAAELLADIMAHFAALCCPQMKLAPYCCFFGPSFGLMRLIYITNVFNRRRLVERAPRAGAFA